MISASTSNFFQFLLRPFREHLKCDSQIHHCDRSQYKYSIQNQFTNHIFNFVALLIVIERLNLLFYFEAFASAINKFTFFKHIIKRIIY